MKKVAVILSGCGHLDGSEIHEAVLCLLHLSLQGHRYYCFAPDKLQTKVMNHLTQEEQEEEPRNVLVEAARIARGKVAPLSQLKEPDFDALLLPGGYGVALNLSDFASAQEACQVDPELESIIRSFFKAKKPIGATCIAPIVVAKALEGVVDLRMTLGSDPSYQQILEKMGVIAIASKADECAEDNIHKIYTTPCYMEPPHLASMHEGIEKMIKKLFSQDLDTSI